MGFAFAGPLTVSGCGLMVWAAALGAQSVRDQYEKDFMKLPEYLARARQNQPSAEPTKEEEPPKQMSLF